MGGIKCLKRMLGSAQNAVCICKRTLKSVGSSLVLIFYLNFERVATLVPQAIIHVFD